MDEKKTETQPTFTKKRSCTRQILGVTIGAVIIILVAAVIVLAVLLVRKENEDTGTAGSGDTGGQGQQTDEPPTTTTATTTTGKPRTTTLPDITVSLSVSSIESGGLVNNTIRISVSYRAPKQHTTDWFVRYQSRDTYRTTGTVTNPGNDDNDFTTEVILRDVVDISLVYLRIYSTTEIVVIEFDNKAPIVKTSVDIPAWKNEIHIEDNLIAPTDSNSNMTIDVSLKFDADFLRMLNESSKSVTDLINEMGDTFIDFINTTANPPKLYEVVQGFPENIFFVDIKSIDGTIVNLTISIPVEYVQYGCLLSLSIPENVTTEFIKRLKHGVSIKVLTPVTNDVVPEGIVAVYPFPNETYIYTKRATLTCFAMGNPHPEVTLYKQGQGQEYYSLKSSQEEFVSDVYTQLVGFTVETDDTDNQGRYMCRARSGQMTSETTTEVIFAQLAVIDATETGVTENTTERTTIKCQASGKPRPTIELNLFEHYGPNLIQTGLYQVTESVQGSDTTIVNLIMSPPDYRIHTVYCVASQDDVRSGEPMKIEIFPFDEGNGVDWELTNRMWDIINGLTHSTTTPSK